MSFFIYLTLLSSFDPLHVARKGRGGRAQSYEKNPRKRAVFHVLGVKGA
jgi:hypothetical protein